MSRHAELSADSRTLAVRVPIKLGKRGGRKVVVAPEPRAATPTSAANPNEALVRAMARAFRWRKLTETGQFATVGELADAESVSASYVARILRMTFLAPEIVEAILDDHPFANMSMSAASRPFPAEWTKQRALFG